MSVEAKLLKKHRLYYRQGRELRSLNRISEDLFLFILNEFLMKGKQAQYTFINRDVKKQSLYEPITLEVPSELAREYVDLFGFSNTTFSYDIRWKPLTTLTLREIKFTRKTKSKNIFKRLIRLVRKLFLYLYQS